MRYDAGLVQIIDERIRQALPSPTSRMGTLVTWDAASKTGTVIFDGDVLPAPMKAFSHVVAGAGDRVGLGLFEGDWVIVGALPA